MVYERTCGQIKVGGSSFREVSHAAAVVLTVQEKRVELMLALSKEAFSVLNKMSGKYGKLGREVKGKLEKKKSNIEDRFLGRVNSEIESPKPCPDN